MTRFTHCIVHAGSHKTGTTSLQHVLAARRTELAVAGFSYPALDRKTRNHNALAHRLATCSDDELPAWRRKLSAAPARLGTRQDGSTALLLSAEEFSTRIGNLDPWAGFDDGAYWEHRRQYLARLRDVLPEGARVEVFLCLRDHESYAHALYATKVLSGRIGGSFGDFVRRCAPIFDYRRQVEVLAEVLGPVRLQSFDALRGDLVNRSFALLGLPVRAENPPRLRATPALDRVHWLARTAHAGVADDERRRRASVLPSLSGRPGLGGAQSLVLRKRAAGLPRVGACRRRWRAGRRRRPRGASPIPPFWNGRRIPSSPSTASGCAMPAGARRSSPSVAASWGLSTGPSPARYRRLGVRKGSSGRLRP